MKKKRTNPVSQDAGKWLLFIASDIFRHETPLLTAAPAVALGVTELPWEAATVYGRAGRG